MSFRKSLLLTGFLVLGVLTPGARAQPEQAGTLGFEALACFRWDELEALYRKAEPGAPPSGFMRGRTIYPPHEALAVARGRIANTFWKGKHFFPECHTLVNQWLVGR